MTVLLAVVAVFVVGAETAIRAGFARISHIESRIASEHAAALRVRRDTMRHPLLLIGNSLLLEGIDLNLLQRALPRSIPVQRFTVEQTGYFEWLFGLRRVLAEGSRPSSVALVLEPSMLLVNGIRGEYSSYYFFRPSDIPALSSALRYDLTKASNLVFARYSLFYAGRNNLRNFVLYRIFPAYSLLLQNVETKPAAPMSKETAFRIASPRLAAFESLCRQYGVRFVYVMPPGFQNREDAILEAAAHDRITMLVPVHNSQWPRSKFRDGHHLNAQGAKEFTTLLAPQLSATLGGN